MQENELLDRVSKLVTEGKIPRPEFVRAYDEQRSVPKQSPQFATLAASADSDAGGIRSAVTQARQDGFFVGLWTALLDRAGGSLFGNVDVAAITEAIRDESAAVGTMQRVLRGAGFRNVGTFPNLMRAARATGLLIVDTPVGRGYGTGFLVGVDLVMTAAHVIFPLVDVNGKPNADSYKQLSVEFWNQLESPGSWPVKVRVAEDWLVDISPPHGTPPALAPEDTLLSPQHLDYALIRLAEHTGVDLGYVDITDPAIPAKDSRLTVIGYPGGTECLSDDQTILAHDPQSCRVRHTANAIVGMSGSPCLDFKGLALAIHEGETPTYNRAVHLKPVRDFLRRNGADPLESTGEPMWRIADADARRDWVTAGKTLVAKTVEDRAQWLELVGAFDLSTAAGAQSGDTFHPVFGRVEFQRWIDEAMGAGAPRRIAMISGPLGTGNSFSVSILRSRVRGAKQQVVSLSPAATRVSSIAPILDLIYGEVAGASRQGPGLEGPRPQAGVVGRDLLPTAFEQIGALIVARPGSSARLWVTIDFGEESNLTPDMTPQWKQFLIVAAKQSWLRVMMMGLDSRRVFELAQAVTSEPVYRETLASLQFEDFNNCVTRILQAVAPGQKQSDWQGPIFDYWDPVGESKAEDGRLVEAVRMALEFRNKVRTA